MTGFETGPGAEIASRERAVRRNSSHQGELMYLAGAVDAAGGLPRFNLPNAAFCGGISLLQGRRSFAHTGSALPPVPGSLDC
jgi:hypothetical protein